MLREAKALGGYLIVAVAPDTTAQHLKGHTPKNTAAQRIALIRQERIADEVVLGDPEINSWGVLKKHKPTVIALGYDQHELRQHLEEYLEKTYLDVETEEGWQANPKKPRIVILSPYKPETHHNRIIYKDK